MIRAHNTFERQSIVLCKEELAGRRRRLVRFEAIHVVRIKRRVIWYTEEHDVLDTLNGVAHEEMGATCNKRERCMRVSLGRTTRVYRTKGLCTIHISYLYTRAACAAFDGTGLVPASLLPAASIR
jgi:hypothetical protein